jgi:hypothetical protein
MRLFGGSSDPASFGAGGHLGLDYRRTCLQCEPWITQRHQDRRDILAKRIFYREQLYSDFISESANALADAIPHDLQDPNKLTPTYALPSRIRLRSSPNVLASAEQVVQHIIRAYSEPKLAAEEIQSRSKRQDPLPRVQLHLPC